MHQFMDMTIQIFLRSGHLVVEVVATVVEIITTTTEKGQCFQWFQELSGRSGCTLNLSGKIANCFGLMSRKK